MQRQLDFKDEKRAEGHLRRIFELMRDGKPRTLAEIREELKLPPDTAVSARLRDFRKKRWGRHAVGLRHVERGVYAYRLTLNPLHPHLPGHPPTSEQPRSDQPAS